MVSGLTFNFARTLKIMKYRKRGSNFMTLVKKVNNNFRLLDKVKLLSKIFMTEFISELGEFSCFLGFFFSYICFENQSWHERFLGTIESSGSCQCSKWNRGYSAVQFLGLWYCRRSMGHDGITSMLESCFDISHYKFSFS